MPCRGTARTAGRRASNEDPLRRRDLGVGGVAAGSGGEAQVVERNSRMEGCARCPSAGPSEIFFRVQLSQAHMRSSFSASQPGQAEGSFLY